MAYTLRITANLPNGKKVELEPAWWDIKELLQSYEFKMVSAYYVDHYLYLDCQSFKKIADSQKNYRNKEFYKDSSWDNINLVAQKKLDYLIQTLDETSTIEIWIYEWESGL